MIMVRRVIILFTFLALSLGIYAQSDSEARKQFSSGNYQVANQFYEMLGSMSEDDAVRNKYYRLANTAKAAADLRSKADKAYKEGDMESAINYYRHLLEKNPNDPKAKKVIEEVESDDIDWNMVLEAQNPADKLNLAQIYLQKHANGVHISEATMIVEEAQREAQRIQSLKSQADSAFNADDYLLAIAKYEEYLKYDAANQDAISKKAKAEEESMWKEILNVDDLKARIDRLHQYLAKYPQGTHTKEAEEFINNSILLKAADVIASQAKKVLAERNYQEASKLYTDAAEACPNDELKRRYIELSKKASEAKAQLTNADKEYKAKNYESALEMYKKILEFNSNDSYAQSKASECNRFIEERKAEEQAWSEVLYATNSEDKAVNATTYLRKYPNGIFKKEAKKVIEENPMLSVSKETVYAYAEGDEQTVTVTTNREWSISAEDNSIYKVSREGNIITVEVKPNRTGASREAYFYIKTLDGNTRVKVKVYQFGSYSSSYSSSYRSASTTSSSSYTNTRTSSESSYYSSPSSSYSSSSNTTKSTYARYCENFGKFDMTWIAVGASVGIISNSSSISSDNSSYGDYYDYYYDDYYGSSSKTTLTYGAALYFSLLRMRIGWFQLCPGEFSYGTSKDGSAKFLYQPSANFVIPVSEKGALYFGAGPSISFDEDDDIWFKVEAGFRAHWGTKWSSDFFFRYDGLYSIGLNIGI